MENNLITNINNIIKFYSNVKQRNMFYPNINNKTLTIIAANVDSEIKYNSLINNIQYLHLNNNDLIIINSTNLMYNNNIKTFCSNKNIKYFEIDNNNTIDFGKWTYILKNNDITPYDFVFFTNDSYIIHNSIHHFYNLTIKMNVELYAYNDSTEINYHYQSYLFSIRKDAIYKFIDMFESKQDIIKGPQCVINNFELKLINYFNTHDCFLKIGNEYYNKNKNIFFKNDVFYNQLFKNKLLPFTKIKRITGNF